MKALLDKGLIQPKDEAIVPDGGSTDGSFVEIAEKSQIWLKFTINGKTSHMQRCRIWESMHVI